MKGSISLPLAAVGAIILTTLSGAAAYFGTVNAQNANVATVKEELKQDIVTAKGDLSDKINSTNLDVKEGKTRADYFEKRLDRFEGKIDELLKANGLNPNKIQ